MLRPASMIFLAEVALAVILVIALGTWLGKAMWWLTLNFLLP